MQRELYADKENRDRRYRELKLQGVVGLRKSSSRNQLLHPMYVQDRNANLTAADKGFGNTLYKTHFRALYIVEY